LILLIICQAAPAKPVAARAQSNAEPRNAGLPDRLVDPLSTPNVPIAVMGMVEK
jgi:hypothetical protein